MELNMAKMATEGFSRAVIEETKYLIKKPRTKVQEEKMRGVQFAGQKKMKAVIQRHPAMFRQNERSGYLLGKMAPQRIRRYVGDAKAQVHLHPTNAESGHHSRLHHCPARHSPQPVIIPEFYLPKSSICRPDICIHIQLFPGENVSIMMRILSTILILIQIC
jgi:hypothetical protein